MSKHYDVAVLGAGIGALTTAALLARRSWRVLVLGQGFRPPFYEYDGVPLARRPFTFLAGSSPAWARVLVELAQSQTFRRKTTPLDPMFQILAPKLRLEVPPDVNLFAREIDRTYPEVRRVVDELYAELARTNAAADAAFERDLVWPPGTFWERRETERIAGAMPRFGQDRDGARPPRAPPLLAEFPRDHDYRSIVDVPARFASHAIDLPEFAVARLHGAWTRGVVGLHGGEPELLEFLLDRIRAHGGEARVGERATRLVHRRGRVSGVIADGDDEPTGVGFVVTDHTARSLLDLTSDFDPPRRALASLPDLIAAEWRFVMSIVVRDEGLPASLGDEAFLLPAWPHCDAGGGLPIVHLQRWRERSGISGATLLVAEAAFPEGGSMPAPSAREAVLATVQSLLPFVERHYLIIDSPHDGRPLWDFRGGSRKDIGRVSFRSAGGSLEPEPMAARWRVTPPSFHGVAAEPLRTPLEGTFVVGPSALPALGQEGELLAAWSAARLITRTDGRKEQMRRDMWRKIELG
ncbi:MAG: phytoene dehydrogenase [Polyangiaceae bacterium]|nr:phytoene dehydrogenase [Polyangiaceae bacterium]